MADFSPANNTITHVEFTQTSQTVNVVDQQLHQWEITDITGYSTSTGLRFDDIVFSTTSKSFTYHSMFEYAVMRKVYYSSLNQDSTELSYGSADNIPLLPPTYDILYKADNPDSSMTVTFNIKGRQRTGELSSQDDQTSSAQQIIWGQWTDWIDDYTITITTNLDKHMQLIQLAASNGRLCKNSQYKPQW